MHLPLILPPGPASSCGINVGGVTVNYTEGKAIVFDDSYSHNTWNEGESERVILLFDIWHPDVKQVERRGVAEMFDYAREQKWLT